MHGEKEVGIRIKEPNSGAPFSSVLPLPLRGSKIYRTDLLKWLSTATAVATL